MHASNLQSSSETADVVRLIEHDALACLPERPIQAYRLAVLASLLRDRPMPTDLAAGGAR